jgi:hypothetical protein
MADKKKNKSTVMKPSAKKAKPAKPNEEKSPSSEYIVGNETTSRGFTLSLAGDKSLQAYKNWINGIMSSIKPNSEDTMTEEEWVESWKKFWSKAESAPEPEPKKRDDLSFEDRYPGITEQLRRFEEAELPSCPHCGSGNTASVQVGVIGRTIYLAASTKKFKLVPNMKDKLGKFFCNACGKFFD